MRIGSLCSGYGGLDLAVEAFYGATPAWFCEYDAAPSRILAHHWPDVPNHQDITAVDWASVEPVDIITGGTPCQDLSHAGRRAGMRAGTRSGIWASMCDAIEIIRPRIVVWENVRGALSAGADSAVEPCPICVGEGSGQHLRALGRVLGDLAELGYDARWGVVRAADAGAAHGRARIFIVATDADHIGLPPAAEDPTQRRQGARVRQTGERRLVPVQRPELCDATRLERTGTGGPVRPFGPYQPSIEAWAELVGRTAPEAFEPGRSGNRLSPLFVEWLMGLPAGHVTDPAIGLTRNQQLKALGNGVVPQQAILALGLLTRQAVAA